MDEKFNPGVIGFPGILTRMRFALSKQFGFFPIILIFISSLIGCSPSTPGFIRPTSDPAWSTPRREIDRAEQKWTSKRISSYRIQVYVWGFWHEQTYTVVVHGGKVVESSATCKPVDASEPCQVYEFVPEGFTVPGLFAVARDKASMSMITFDPEYGYPSIISYNDSWIADEEEEWTVLEFIPEN